MQIIRDIASCPPACQEAVVAIGNFDGVHIGHQAILQQAKTIARETKNPLAVMSFEPHPREFLSRQAGDAYKSLRLTSFREKAKLLAGLETEVLFAARFNRSFATMSASSFVQDILVRSLHVHHVVTGYNFAFGKNRKGNTVFLEGQAQKARFGYTICPPVADTEGTIISSSAIRSFLADGDVGRASAMLGRAYTLEGCVQRGDQRGRSIGFPTANLSLGKLYKPRFGVYAVRFRVEDEERNYNGVANIGIRPSFNGQEPLLEVHAFEADLNLYGKCLRVELADFIRDEQKFPDVESLQAQIQRDCARAKQCLVEYAA